MAVVTDLLAPLRAHGKARTSGLADAAIRVSPRRSAMLQHDSKAAEGMRGVKKILPVTNGLAVVADNTWRAFQAAKAINCEWAPAPYPAPTEPTTPAAPIPTEEPTTAPVPTEPPATAPPPGESVPVAPPPGE